MIVQPQSSRWQTVITDLSLILFLVCAAALQDAPIGQDGAPSPALAAPAALPEAPVTMAVWREGTGGISLPQWLAEQTPDDSQRLSIEVSYRKGGFETAWATADRLRRTAGPAGTDARVLIAEGATNAVLAQLVQDDAPAPTGPEIAVSR